MTKEQIEHMFTYHAPTIEQTLKYNLLTQEFLKLALLVEETVKDSGDRTIALRRLHEARMLTNAAVALGG